jgi:hypothetical protein
MSLIVAFLTADTPSVDAANEDRWTRIAGQGSKRATRCPSPFRASPRGRVTHLFGAH